MIDNDKRFYSSLLPRFQLILENTGLGLVLNSFIKYIYFQMNILKI